MLGKVLKRSTEVGAYDLHPRLFRQVIDPFKGRSSCVKPPDCIATFYDHVNKCVVTHNLGPVICYPKNPYAHRSASLMAQFPVSIVSLEGKDADLCAILGVEHCPQRGTSEDRAQVAEIESGSYVITRTKSIEVDKPC